MTGSRKYDRIQTMYYKVVAEIVYGSEAEAFEVSRKILESVDLPPLAVNVGVVLIDKVPTEQGECISDGKRRIKGI